MTGWFLGATLIVKDRTDAALSARVIYFSCKHELTGLGLRLGGQVWGGNKYIYFHTLTFYSALTDRANTLMSGEKS